MCVQLMQWAFDLQDERLDPAQKAVLLALCNHAEFGKPAFPSVERLQTYTAYSRRTVFRALSDLETHGFIRRERNTRGDGRKSTSNRYYINALIEPEKGAGAAPIDDERVREPHLLVREPHLLVREPHSIGARAAPHIKPSREPSTNREEKDARERPPLDLVPDVGKPDLLKPPDLLTPRPPDGHLTWFEACWQIFDRTRRGSKFAGRKAWEKVGAERIGAEIHADITAKLGRHRQWVEGYAPMFSTYCNIRGWTEDLVEVKTAAGGATPTTAERNGRQNGARPNPSTNRTENSHAPNHHDRIAAEADALREQLRRARGG